MHEHAPILTFLPLGTLPEARYPDPRVKLMDKRFTYVQRNAAIERIASGFRWAEGPVYFRGLRCLIWSDIPNNRMMRWLEEDGLSIHQFHPDATQSAGMGKAA
jgi:gluconolactonase